MKDNSVRNSIGLILCAWTLLTFAWVGMLVALPAYNMGRVKIAWDANPDNPAGTYCVVYGSTNASHMTADRKALAPVKRIVIGTNTVLFTNLFVTKWYFMAENRFSNNVSLPSDVLAVSLVAPPKGIVIKEAYPAVKPSAPVE